MANFPTAFWTGLNLDLLCPPFTPWHHLGTCLKFIAKSQSIARLLQNNHCNCLSPNWSSIIIDHSIFPNCLIKWMQHLCLTDHVAGPAETLCGNMLQRLFVHCMATKQAARCPHSVPLDTSYIRTHEACMHKCHVKNFVFFNLPNLPSSNLNLNKHLLNSAYLPLKHPETTFCFQLSTTLQDLVTSIWSTWRSQVSGARLWLCDCLQQSSSFALHLLLPELQAILCQCRYLCPVKAARKFAYTLYICWNQIVYQIQTSTSSSHLQKQHLKHVPQGGTHQLCNRVSWILEQLERPGMKEFSEKNDSNSWIANDP